jgi:hypothetical protein
MSSAEHVIREAGAVAANAFPGLLSGSLVCRGWCFNVEDDIATKCAEQKWNQVLTLKCDVPTGARGAQIIGTEVMDSTATEALLHW